jgi:hypothetical protein
MSSSDNGISTRAARELLAHGWLRDGSLRHTYLEKANLEEGYLEMADLQGANMRKANLQRANLFGAKLQGAYLLEADLRGADLWQANLQGSYLTEKDLRLDEGRTGLGAVTIEIGPMVGVHVPSAKLDETTRLPNGEHWNPDMDIAQFNR